MAKKIKTAEEIRAEALETASIVDDAMRNIASSLQEAFGEAGNEISDLGKEFTKEAKRGLKGLTDNAEALFEAQDKGKKGLYSQKDIQKEIEKKNKAIFVIQSKITQAIKNGASNSAELTKQLSEAEEVADKFLKDLEKASDQSKKITKAMGLTGAGLSSLKKVAGKLGLSGLEDTFTEARDASAEMANKVVASADAAGKTVGLGGKIKVAFAGASVAAAGIGKALMDPLVIVGAIVKSVKFLVGLVNSVRKQTNSVGQVFGIAGDEARQLSHQIDASAAASDSLFYNSQELLESSKELNSISSLNLKFNEKNARTFQDLAQYSGLGVKNTKELFKIAIDTGKPFDSIYQSVIDTANVLNKSTGDYVQVGAIVDQMSSSSAAVRRSFGDNFNAMVKTAHAAARLGTTMDEIKSSSRGAADFQSSIEDEMKAEMMIGKELNLDAYRAAVMSKDVTKMAEERRKIILQTAKATDKNLFATEAVSKLIGIGADEYDKQLLSLQENAKMKGKMSKGDIADAKKQKELGEQAAKFDRVMSNLLANFRKAFIPIAEKLEPAMERVANTITKLGSFMASADGKSLVKLLGGVVGGAIVIKAGSSLLKIFTGGLLKRGNTSLLPLFVKDVGGKNESGSNPATDMVSNMLGKRFTKSMKWTKSLSKMLGGKRKGGSTIGKMMRNLSAMFGKRSSFINQIVKNNKGLSKLFPSMSKLTSKIPNAAATATESVGKTGLLSKLPGLSKLTPVLTKTMKVLGPIGVAADLVMGGYTGAEQSDLSAKAQKEAGVKEGVSKGEAIALGTLTGGANKGSMFTEMLGGEKGSAGDEMLGIGTAAARGAMAGGAVGLALAPITAGISVPVAAAVGAVVGTVSEGFKVFSDPNSSLRKGLTSGLSSIGSSFTEVGSDVVTGVQDFFGFATGGIAPGGFKAFANGGTVSSPTLGMIGEGRYNEAIVPLPDGRSIPVKMEGGGGGNAQVVSLLKELITVVKNGGDIYMDGAKVGKSMVMATSNLG